MNSLIITALLVYGAQALLSQDHISEEWQKFKRSHRSRFFNAREEQFRRSIFQKKLAAVEEHNEKYRQGFVSYEIGLNEFSDRTDEEMQPYTHGLIVPEEFPEPTVNISFLRTRGVAVPASVDWRSRGVVNPVKNQGSCGSCWAFSTTGALESHLKIQHGSGYSVSLSEQNLVDCVSAAYGCSGGWMADAYAYIATNGGLNTDQVYSYEARNGPCRYNPQKSHVSIKGYARLPGADENLLRDVVANNGPVSVAIDASGPFSGYRSGVYYNPNCNPTKFTHAVVVVGYGNENGLDYWLVRNSWGPSWGQGGYIKMARNRSNHCGIAGAASYPVLLK